MGCGTSLRTAILGLSQTPFLRAVMGGGGTPLAEETQNATATAWNLELTSENRAHVVYVDARLQVGRLAPVVRAHR